MNGNDTVCKLHAGIVSDIEHAGSDIERLESANKAQWKEINGMKKFIIGTLASAVITLLVVLCNLMVTLARTGAP